MYLLKNNMKSYWVTNLNNCKAKHSSHRKCKINTCLGNSNHNHQWVFHNRCHNKTQINCIQWDTTLTNQVHQVILVVNLCMHNNLHQCSLVKEWGSIHKWTTNHISHHPNSLVKLQLCSNQPWLVTLWQLLTLTIRITMMRQEDIEIEELLDLLFSLFSSGSSLVLLWIQHDQYNIFFTQKYHY